jgi:formylglycine-generating enzyme required for sulfatase activity
MTLLLALAALLSTGAAAETPLAPVELGRKEFSRKFDTRRVGHAFSLSTDRPLKRGDRVELRLTLSTQLTGTGLGRTPRAGLIDGYVALALPPELVPLDRLRLYVDDATESAAADRRARFLYSAGLPATLARFASLGLAPDPASAGNAALFGYYSAAAQRLDPQATVFAPAAQALRRDGANGSLQSAAWLMPVDARRQPLLDLFGAEAGGSAPGILARLPVRVAGDVTAARLKLFAGALSCAGAVVDIPPGLAPPGALPLSELDPRAYPPPQPTKAAPDPAAATLVYSCEWESWEADVPLVPATAAPALAIPELPAVDGSPSIAREAAPAGAEPAGPVAAAPVERTPDGGAGSTARQVEIGTLPAPGGETETPLKPITGAAGQRASQSDASFAGPSGSEPLPPPPGFAGTAPGSVRYYGPGGPDNLHGGSQAPPAQAPPGLGSMVLVPAGEFLMGTDAGTSYGDADELPQHKVYLPAYLIDKYPVTNRQFAQFVVSSAYQPEGDWQRYNSPALLDLPVRSVTWNDAKAYARWAGKRLPTEAEWEKAARGTDGRLYPWGNDWNAEILPRGEFGYALVTAPRAASPYGAMAMCGVLWQWTASPWHEYPYDPAARGDKLILRGGAFSNGRNIVRCANRYFEQAGVALNTFTFRCVKDAK